VVPDKVVTTPVTMLPVVALRVVIVPMPLVRKLVTIPVTMLPVVALR